jgi:glycosyltransferase involved in cell wall biosynthesis
MKSKEDFKYAFTVFTPTYNRAPLLPRVYECLEKQTFRDFEWLVVDDGSTDNTAEVMRELQAKASFPVRYVAKPNGGKPTAVNRGVKEATGLLFAILDSDDWFVPESLERFWHHWQSIPADLQPGFIGVTGLCSYPSGELIGDRFPQDVFDSDAIDLRYRYKVQGEKGGMLRTEILRQFPYPEDLGKYVSESLVWNRIAKSYQTRFVNEVLTVKEFQPGGITRDGRFIQIRDTRASLLCAKELAALGNRLPLGPRVRAYANYVRHSLRQEIPIGTQVAGVPSKTMFFLCLPLGVYLKNRDNTFVNREQKRRLAGSSAN